jgi:hypothetical protein
MDKYAIELKNLRVLEDLKTIPDTSVPGEVTFKSLSECSEELIVDYIEGLVGFVIISNLTVS